MTWLPLRDDDPVPGDPFGTGDLGAYFHDEAAKLRAIVTELRSLDAGIWEGDAAEAFSRRRTRLIPHLEALATRWEGGGTALKTWAPVMDDAKTTARRALRDAQDADERRMSAQTELDEARARAGINPYPFGGVADPFAAFRPPATEELPPGVDLSRIQWLERQVAEREAEIAQARVLLGQAEELYGAGSRRCEAALHAAADDTIQDRGGVLASTRRALHHVVRRYPQIKTVAKGLGLAAGALALTASLFTGVGALATGAFIVGGLATALDIGLLASGDGKWTTVAWDLFGLATFGLSRAYASAARGTASAETAEAARRLATRSLKGVFAEGVRSAEPIAGAAAQSRLLKLYSTWKGFGPEAARGIWPEGRNWLKAVTFWKQIEIPPPDVLRLSRDAVRYGSASRAIDGIGHATGIRGIVAAEQEYFDKQAERSEGAPTPDYKPGAPNG